MTIDASKGHRHRKFMRKSLHSAKNRSLRPRTAVTRRSARPQTARTVRLKKRKRRSGSMAKLHVNKSEL